VICVGAEHAEFAYQTDAQSHSRSLVIMAGGDDADDDADVRIRISHRQLTHGGHADRTTRKGSIFGYQTRLCMMLILPSGVRLLLQTICVNLHFAPKKEGRVTMMSRLVRSKSPM